MRRRYSSLLRSSNPIRRPARRCRRATRSASGSKPSLRSIDRGRRSGQAPSRSAGWRRRWAASRPNSTATQQSRRLGCEASGFFQIFGGAGRSEQCGPLNNQISQMRANLARVQNDLQRLQSVGANYERDGQRRAVLKALAQNDCGPQYRAQAAQSRQSFRDPVRTGSAPGVEQNHPGDGGAAAAAIARCACAPATAISSRSRSRPRRTASATTRRPASACARPPKLQLFSHRNPGEDMRQAVSTNAGKLYTRIADRVQIQDRMEQRLRLQAGE